MPEQPTAKGLQTIRFSMGALCSGQRGRGSEGRRVKETNTYNSVLLCEGLSSAVETSA